MSAAVKEVEVKEKPFILSNEKVRAILAGRKTQERRLVTIPKWLQKMEPDVNRMYPGKAFGVTPCLFVCCADGSQQRLRNPYGWPDTVPVRLWVREAMRCDERGMFYAADETIIDKSIIPTNLNRIAEENDPFHMPRWASRITLEIQGVRVERVQEISEADAEAEAAQCLPVHGRDAGPRHEGGHWSCVKGFAQGWDALNAKRGFSWASNPWCWVLEFRKL